MEHSAPTTDTATTDEAINDREGSVKWFDARKGFGFLVGPEGQDIFVHFSTIEQDAGFKTLRDGEAVVYSANRGPKGWAATKVRATRAADAQAEVQQA